MVDFNTAVDDYLAQPLTDPAAIPLLKNTMASAITVKPDYEAELNRAAKITGVPVQSARTDPEFVKARAATLTMDIDGLAERSPRTADFLIQGDNARIAHDDIGVLESTEHYLKRVGLPANTPVLQAAPPVRATPMNLLRGLFNSTGLDMTNAALSTMLGDALGWTEKWAGYDTIYGRQALFPRDTSNYQRDFRMAKGRSDALTPEINDPTLRGVYGAGQSIVQTAPAIAVSVATKSPYPALAVMGAQSGLGQYGEVRARGGSAGEAAASGALTGGIEAGTELLPMGFLVNKFGKKGALAFLGGILAREVPGEQIATLAQDAVDTAIANPDKTWGEYLAERPEAAYQTLVATVGQSLLMGGASAGMSAVVNRGAAQEQAAVQAEKTTAGVEAIMQMAEASKLRERAPETFSDFVAQAAEGGPVENVYVDAEVLAQSVNTPESAALLAAAPELATAMQEAQVSGQDVKIPVETFATVFAGTPVYEALKDHLKTSPDGMTRTQAQEYMATQSESLRADFERVMAEKEADDGFKASAEAVTANVAGQLATAGRFTSDVNEKYAALTGQFYAVQAARLGVTPEDMFARYPLRVDAGNGQTMGVYNKLGPDLTAPPVDEAGNIALTHWGKRGKLKTLDPSKFGSNFEILSREERMRAERDDAPGRTYFGIGVGEPGGYVPEHGLGKHHYSGQVPASALYDYDSDPLGLRAGRVKELLAEEGFDEGPEAGQPDYGYYEEAAVAYDKAIQEAGFKGFWTGQQGSGLIGALFDKTDVKYEGADELNQGGVELPLKGLTQNIKVDGKTVKFGPFAPARDAAREYARVSGIPYFPPTEYAKVDEERAKRIAAEFEAMKHDPADPEVRAAYDAMIAETLAQWEVIKETGLQVEFIEGEDPYGNPRNAILDVTENNHLWVFPTSDGFGGSESADVDISGNPLLAIVPGEEISGRPVQANDIFRTVHDYFGHIKEGVGFRADGEENAWRMHSAMYSMQARRAMTTETRGQNSWVNFGPYAESNKTANPADTQYAPQKIGLLPEWVMTEGATDSAASEDELQALSQNNRGTFNPRTNTISLLRTADLSTFLHELGHFQLEVLTDLAGQPNAPQEIVDDVNTLLAWFGVPSLIDWNAKTLDEKRESHEKFARGFEAYLFEGKAPSLKLRGIFQRFRAWMLNVYRELTNLNVELQPDVRQVMDRMLATSEEIKIAEDSRVFAPLFSSKPAEMTDEEWVNYQNLGAQATQDAISELETRSLRDMRWLENTKDRILRGLQKEAREKRKAVKAEVVAEVSAEPVNRARQYLKRGLTEGSDTPVEGPHKLSTKAVGELYADLPEELQDWKRLGFGRYGMLAEDGVHPDVLADLLGYPSGAALVEDLLTAESYNDKVAGVTDQRMLERYGDLTDEDAMGRAADEAIHNDARLRFVATELNALEKAIGGRRVLAAAARQFAEELVQRLKIKDLRTAPYTSAETRAARAADKALKGGDMISAATQKRNQLINGHAARAVFNAKGEVVKSMALFKRIISAKDESTARNRNMDLVNAARAILAQYGIGAAKNTPDHYMGLLKAYDPGLHADLEPFLAASIASAAPVREITLEQFQGLRDTVAQLWELSRRAKVIEIDGKQVEIEAVTAELGNRLDVLGVPLERPGETEEVTKAQRFMRGLSGLRAAARRVESWARTIDGADQGPFRKYLWQPISEAADRYRIDKAAYLKRYLDIVKTVEETLKPAKIAPVAGGIRYTFSGRAELLHAILHTGNESNKRKLLLGRSWGKLTAEGELDDSRWQATVAGYIANGTLTKTDFDFAQAVWDLLDETKAGAQKAHRTVYGRYFNEVTADSFETPWGIYRGGYVPALTDSFLVQDAAVRAEQDAIDASNATMFPSPTKGFTKGRVEDYTRELALDLRLLPQHIDKVLKFAHLAPPVRDAMRVLKARGFAAKLERFDPVAQTDLLLPWLNRAAKQIVETPSSGAAGKMADTFFRTLRSRTGMGVMFANITNALQQLTGFSVSAVRVKPKYLRNALWQYIRNPSRSADSIQALSPFMISRTTNQVFETQQAIDALLLNPSKYEKARDFTKQHAYFLQSAFQNLVDNVTWMGAYAQAQDQGQTDKEASRFANSVVRETQGSLAAEDVSRFETGSPFVRLFTQFQSFFNGMANLMGTELGTTMRDLGLRKGAGRMAYVYMMGFMIPAVISEVIVQAMRGGLDDDDDDGSLDEILQLFFGSQIRFGTAMIPIAGPMAMGLINAANDKPYDDRISTGPAIAAIEASVRSPTEVYQAIAEGKNQKKAVKDSLTAITLLTGIPVSALGRPAGYLADVNEGKVRPTGVVDLGRGLITGSASPGSKQ